MKVMWHSNAAWCGSGYGVQTAHAVELLRAMGHEVAVSASYGLNGNVLRLDGVLTIPGADAGDPYGVQTAPVNGEIWGADVLVTLLDAWVFEGQRFADRGQRWVALAPIDHEPIPRRVRRSLAESWWPASFSRSGLELMIAEGLTAHGEPPLFIPHAFDPSVYRPVTDEQRMELRRRLKIPPEAFAVGMVAANKGQPSRKNFPAVVEAFAGLLAAHPDVVLVLHTEMDSRHTGINIFELLKFFGIPETAIRFSDQERPFASSAHMAGLYQSLDVLVNPALGEGFGVPILEAQACGTPVIVGDWTAMSEVAADESWKIPRDEALRVFTIQDAFQYMAFPAALLDRMEAAYAERGTTAAAVRRAAVAEHADQWSLPSVGPAWAEAFGKIAARIEAEGKAGEQKVEVLP